MAARSSGILMALNPYQVMYKKLRIIMVFCAIIASCFEMDVYSWLNQDSLNGVFHFRSRRWGK